MSLSSSVEHQQAPSDDGLLADDGSGTPLQDISALQPEVSPTTAEDGSANVTAGASAASFALLDDQPGTDHPATDAFSFEASASDASPGSGSINVIGAPLQEAHAGDTVVGLHIATPVDSGFAATTDAGIGPAGFAPTPIVSLNLSTNPALTPFAGHAAEDVGIIGHAETAIAHPTGQAGDASAAATAVLASLENSPAGSAVTNSTVGSGGATAAQVQQALDEGGLSVNGSGIKVGVLSDSFNDLGGAATDEADGALPSASNVQILSDLSSGGTDEGRAMMQIVHDIAPGSSLAFYTADNSEQDFANGILALAAAGCKVICDDVSYFDEPFFQNGIVAQAIQTVEAEGVTYVTSAGNNASNAYQAAWTPGSGYFDGWYFDDAELFNGSLAQTVTITASAADPVPLLLEWNKAYGSANFNLGQAPDVDMFVFHNGQLIAQATNGVVGEPNNPFTGYEFTASGTYQIVIANNFGPDPGVIKEILAGNGLPETISGANAGTVFGHAMTPGVITAGAVSTASTPGNGADPVSESFSSSGAGTELLFANNGTPLSSPDVLNPVVVSGVDDIATTVSGGLHDFYGTSAASASLAGVSALILAANPHLTSTQVEAIMEETALSMANPAVSGAGLVRVDPAVELALGDTVAVIQTDVTTSLGEMAGNFFLGTVGSSNLGPELTYGASPVTSGEFGGWVPIGAVQVGNGYDVAWKNPGTGQYTVWSTDSDGNYLANLIPAVSANSASLEALETTFNQDLNGDGSIGVASKVIQVDGSTALTEIGNDFYLYTSGSGPELQRGGAAVTDGEYGTWTPIGAVQVAGGYDVAWKDPSSGLYTVWSTDSHGNYLANLIGAVPANSVSLEAFETTFNQDLNGDGNIGIPTKVIQVDGSTALTEIAGNFYLYTSGSGPELQRGGAAVTDGEYGTWTPIGAVQVAGGYDVAWKDPASGLYTVWSTDSHGNYVANLIGAVPGNSASLEAFETTFNQDLNGDGTIGIPTKVIQVDGSTALTEIAGNFYLYTSGSGPELQRGGAAVTDGEYGTWTPIGAVQVTGGYDVAWKDSSSGLYTVWSTDSHGNYVANLIPAVPGNSASLEALETTFNQDLNGDGTIGVPTASAPAAAQTAQVSQTAFDGHTLTLDMPSAFSGELAGFGGDGTLVASDQVDLRGFDFNALQTSFDSASGTLSLSSGSATASLYLLGQYAQDAFHFASDGNGGTLVVAATQAAATTAVASFAAHDTFVFAPNFGNLTLPSFTPATDSLQFSKTVFSNIAALLAATHDDGSGNAVITDAAHDTITLQHVTTAQLIAHQSDFHFV